VFNWRSKQGSLGDWEDIPLKGRTIVICFDADARHNRMVLMAMRRLGMWLESKGASEHPLPDRPGRGQWHRRQGRGRLLPRRRHRQGLRDAATTEMPSDNTRDAAFSDAVLADTVCSEALEGRYRWAAGLGWMRWDGKVWVECTDATVMEEIRQWALAGFQKRARQAACRAEQGLRTEMDGWRGYARCIQAGQPAQTDQGHPGF
jgi:hypothetical protein